jgi:hypothetical protein
MIGEHFPKLGFHDLAGGGVRQLVDKDDPLGQHPFRELDAEKYA